MADTGPFAIKGVRDGLLVNLAAEETWADSVKRLIAHIDEQGAFFTGARLVVDVDKRPVRKSELGALQNMLAKRQVTLVAVMSESMTTLAAARKLGLQTTLETAGESARAAEPSLLSSLLREAEDEPLPIDPEELGTTGVLVKRTLRNGRTVHSDGHVVVLGDVNPGAEIIAGGDVLVWGRLRGVVHAGAQGDESAIVCALDMTPTQLRIAGHIATSPEDKRRRPRPEMAIVRDRRIVVETWKG